MSELEARAVALFREHYAQLDDTEWQHAPNHVAHMATCAACLQILDVEDDQEFDDKYGVEEE